MSRDIHRLEGCQPVPLGSYLKALAVHRLVAEQRDASARGFWRDEVFHLATALDRDALVRFFAEEYAPTPMLAPWNGGSGFYPKDKKDGIEGIATATATRFAAYSAAVHQVKSMLGRRSDKPKERDKDTLLRTAGAEWDGNLLRWLGAAVEIGGDGTPQYPALLGTGGNDGRLDFTNNLMQRLVELFDPKTGTPRPRAAELLDSALFGTPIHGATGSFSVGQLLPGGAGGPNGTRGFEGRSPVNPWDFVLMLEGTLLFEVAAVRKMDGADLPQAAAPFAVRAQAGGYAGAASVDESPRGEQWMPIWAAPATLPEVRALFHGGRLRSGRKTARDAIDAGRALARLGASRGITAFHRFGYIERNGQSNLAVPLGDWPVALRPEVRLLDEIDLWLDRLRGAANGKDAPASLERAARRITDRILALAREGGSAARWEALLCELAAAEDDLVRRARTTGEKRLQPLPPLSAGWYSAVDDGGPEVRLAVVIASQVAPDDALRSPDKRIGPIRANCMPLDPESDFQRFRLSGDLLARDARVVWAGRNLVSDLGAIVDRRLLDGARASAHGLPLAGRVFPALRDVDQFLAAELDDGRIARLARGFMALRWNESAPVVAAAIASSRRCRWSPSALISLFRLVYLPDAHGDLHPRLDRAPLRLLAAGRLEEASEAARRRLSAAGARPKARQFSGPPWLAHRIRAALAIPISHADLDRMMLSVCKPVEEASSPSDFQEVQ